jgi:hypothetical protein
VLGVDETDAELVIRIETIGYLVGCAVCGVVATAHDRTEVEHRDLAAFGRLLRGARCAARTWTERSPAFSARCLLTDRARRERCLEVGLTRPVAQMVRGLGSAGRR